ncbi:MAG TPA: hypothetical protein VFG72_12620 [Marmoricola sp.]|nr:hypothetical protein [Marmoricola sp.]
MWVLYLELLLLLLVPFVVGAFLARFVVRVAVRRTEADVRPSAEVTS